MRRVVPVSILLLLLTAAVSSNVDAARNWDWVSSDWSGGAWASRDSVQAELSPGELSLEADPLAFIPAFDATARAGIWALAARRDTLYLGVCDDPMSLDGGEILAYDLSRDSLWLEFEVFEQGIAVLREAGGVVYSPGIDNMGSHDWGNVYLDEGAGWVRKETVPQALHVDDMLHYQGRYWVSTGNDGPGFEGKLFASDDAGETWSEEFSLPASPPDSPFRRLYGLTEFGGSLFVQSDFRVPEGPVIFELTGSGVVSHVVDATDYCLAGFAEFDGKLLCMTRTLLNIYDGVSWSSQWLDLYSSNFASRAIRDHDDRLYVGGNHKIVHSTDLQTWTEAAVSSGAGREFKDFANYHGRLWAASLGEGELFVNPGALSGELVSLPHAFPGPAAGGLLDWEGDTPPGCALAFQLRSAAHPALLEAAPFLGPDGTGASFYLTAGQSIAAVHDADSHFQYRVLMSSAAPRLSPVLKSVTLTLDPLVTGAPTIAPAGELALWPNPLRVGSRLHLAQPLPPGCSLVIYDARGRRLRTIRDPAAGGAVWDGRDDFGHRLPAGAYRLALLGVDGKLRSSGGLTMIR
jgi:hypothetical protein